MRRALRFATWVCVGIWSLVVLAPLVVLTGGATFNVLIK